MKKSGIRHHSAHPSDAVCRLRASSGGVANRGFTVIEILVAVGAVAIVTIGLAAIFDAVGKTVQGGRRLSVLTQYSTMIEDRLRSDFASIDPNSFLVIRQQLVDNGDGKIDMLNPELLDTVQVYEGQPNAERRPRRIDELLIFARGEFASMRPPIAEERVARGREARIYYGMGHRMTPSYDGSNAEVDYLRPYSSFRSLTPVTVASMPPLGKTDPAGSTVNRYASDFTLLRHVTVLCPPGATQSELPNLASLGVVPPIGSAQAADRDGQIALQPAAATIFRSTLVRFPAYLDPSKYRWLVESDFPRFATGTVDVVTTDLDEVRSFVVGVRGTPGAAVQNFNLFPPEPTFDFSAPGRGAVLGVNVNNVPSLYTMQAWMSDAFPTESLPANAIPNYWESNANLDPPEMRLRYETQPPDMRAVMESSTPTIPEYGSRALQDAYERSAQVMLTAHNLVPRCTEFIVEWSFGRVNPTTSQLIWHGPPRPGLSDQELCFYPYIEGNNIATRLEEGKLFEMLYKDAASANPNEARVKQQFHPFTDRLIYGYSPDRDPTTVPAAVTSYFGYIDPTFDPSNPVRDDPSTPSVDESSGLVGVATDKSLMEWPRPKLVRITMSLADPRDPKVEETFQFVLEVPQERAK